MASQTLIHADIFFFIASIGFTVVTIALLIGLFYIIRVVRSVDRITTKIEIGIDTVSDDAKDLVADLRDSMAFRMIFGGQRKRKKSSTEPKR